MTRAFYGFTQQPYGNPAVHSPFDSMKINSSGAGAVIGRRFAVTTVELNVRVQWVRKTAPYIFPKGKYRIVVVKEFHPHHPDTYIPNWPHYDCLMTRLFHRRSPTSLLMPDSVFKSHIHESFEILHDSLHEMTEHTIDEKCRFPDGDFHPWGGVSDLQRIVIPFNDVVTCRNDATEVYHVADSNPVTPYGTCYVDQNMLWVLILSDVDGFGTGISADEVGFIGSGSPLFPSQEMHTNLSSKVYYNSL